MLLLFPELGQAAAPSGELDRHIGRVQSVGLRQAVGYLGRELLRGRVAVPVELVGAIFRNRSGRPYSTRIAWAMTSRPCANSSWVGGTRQLADFRRSGTVEALAHHRIAAEVVPSPNRAILFVATRTQIGRLCV
jgi:hypothetical protein